MSNLRTLTIYGEYFGGWYPVEGVKQDGHGAGQPVQQRVAYAPAQQFFAFDVKVDDMFLDFDTAVKLLEASGFPYVDNKPICRGSFSECMAVDVDTMSVFMFVYVTSVTHASPRSPLNRHASDPPALAGCLAG